MGFFDSFGKVLGKLAAIGEEVKNLKSDYECMSDNELKREYNVLRTKSGSENRNRLMAVKLVLADRGIDLPGSNS